MRLIRRDKSFTSDPDNPNDYGHDEYGYEKDKFNEVVRVDFPDLGRGKQKRPSFYVEVTWIDVKNILRAFMEMGEDDAVFIHQALKLSDAIEEAGWSPSSAPTEEFRELMLPQLK